MFSFPLFYSFPLIFLSFSLLSLLPIFHHFTSQTQKQKTGLMIGQCTQSKVSTDHGMYVCQVYGLDIFGNRLNTTLSGLNRDGSVVTPRNIASDYSADVYGLDFVFLFFCFVFCFGFYYYYYYCCCLF